VVTRLTVCCDPGRRKDGLGDAGLCPWTSAGTLNRLLSEALHYPFLAAARLGVAIAILITELSDPHRCD
jgi:hypothetical protein